MFRLAKHRVLNLTGAGINELTRNEIASLILGVLDAEMCRAKYKYKRRKLLLLYIYIYVIYWAGGPYGKKTVPEVLSTARRRRPRAALQTKLKSTN